MNNRRNYNSIVFLTVYLGLVLVGGSPQILAQAATPRLFDLKTEIGYKDDLDKKPDDGISQDVETIANLKITEAIVDFVANLKKLESDGKFNPAEDWNFSHKVFLEHFEVVARSENTSSISNSALANTVADLIAKAKSDLPSISDYFLDSENQKSRKTSLEVQSTANDFSLSFGFVKKSSAQARLAAEAFNKFFINQKASLKDSAKLPIYENTKAHTENNQVFIVTRLPRASIDELLVAENAR